MPAIQGAVGAQNNPDSSALITTRMGKQGELSVSELHGRFYEQTYRGNVYTGGMTAITSISAATFTTATTGATATPIVGLWNPLSNSVNLVVLQATLALTLTAATNTGCGGFVWMVGTGSNAISTGNAPMNRKTLAASGSNAKAFGGAALTSLTGTLSVMTGSALNGGSAANFSFVGTAVGQATLAEGSVENFDGSLIIPPGGVLGLFATTTPVGHSAVSGISWEEVPT